MFVACVLPSIHFWRRPLCLPVYLTLELFQTGAFLFRYVFVETLQTHVFPGVVRFSTLEE